MTVAPYLLGILICGLQCHKIVLHTQEGKVTVDGRLMQFGDLQLEDNELKLELRRYACNKFTKGAFQGQEHCR